VGILSQEKQRSIIQCAAATKAGKQNYQKLEHTLLPDERDDDEDDLLQWCKSAQVHSYESSTRDPTDGAEKESIDVFDVKCTIRGREVDITMRPLTGEIRKYSSRRSRKELHSEPPMGAIFQNTGRSMIRLGGGNICRLTHRLVNPSCFDETRKRERS